MYVYLVLMSSPSGGDLKEKLGFYMFSLSSTYIQSTTFTRQYHSCPLLTT